MGRCRISFHGAAQTVTGSKYLLEANGSRILIDCGLFQGLKKLRLLNWSDLPFPAESIQSILLTHAHLDHTGYLPRFVKDGCECPVDSTRATGGLTRLILADSARIWKGVRRLRVRVYGIIYAFNGSRLLISVVRVGHRREVYR